MKRCQKCGEEWTRREQPGFKEACPKCTAYLHSCVNCKLYNPSADRCSSVTAECPGDRQGLNYCEEFEFRSASANANHAASRTAKSGNGGSQTQLGFDEPAARVNPSGKQSNARRKFDKLFSE
jgi:hypothetical protein